MLKKQNSGRISGLSDFYDFIKMGITHLSILVLGLIQGIKHAIDADHVAAVITIVSGEKSVRKSTLVGIFWGIGHTLALLIVGTILLLLRTAIPKHLSLYFEFAVGVMLIILGINVIVKIHKKKIHLHPHNHSNVEHIHFHSHFASVSHEHSHRAIKKSLFVGILHGMAGSGGITLLILAGITNYWHGLIYLLVFGVGTILGMALLSSIISLPFTIIPAKLNNAKRKLEFSAGAMSIILGITLMYSILFYGG